MVDGQPEQESAQCEREQGEPRPHHSLNEVPMMPLRIVVVRGQSCGHSALQLSDRNLSNHSTNTLEHPSRPADGTGLHIEPSLTVFWADSVCDIPGSW